MSYRLVDQVLSLEGLHRTDKQVLTVLASRADHDGTSCYPGQTWIAKQVGISDRAVREALDHLEHHQWIKRRRRRRDTTLYTITIGAGVTCLVANRRVCLGRRPQVLDRNLGSLNSVTSTTTRTTSRGERGRVRIHVYRWKSQQSPAERSVTQSASRPAPKFRSRIRRRPKEFEWTPPPPREPQPEVDLAALKARAERHVNGSAA